MGRHRGPVSILGNDITFELDRLFDHHNYDHIPVARRLDGFTHRNLPHIKHYKAAVNIFGGPMSRKRVIIAPPMETPLKHKLGFYVNQREDPEPPVLNNPLQPAQPPARVLSAKEKQEQAEKDEEEGYEQWLAQRRVLRSNLDGMGLSEDFLQRKTDKTELEQRVHNKMKAKRLWKPESPPPPEPEPEEKEPPVVPSVKVPVPTALQILDKFLTENKMRLVDLFRKADRNNDWKLTKEELTNAIKMYNIPLSVSDVEDLMVTLDRNFDEHLDFKELSQGLAALKAERRAIRRQGSGGQRPVQSQPTSLSKISPLSRDQMMSNQSSKPFSQQDNRRGVEYTAEDLGEAEIATGAKDSSTSGSPSRSGSAQRSRSATPNSLEVPQADLRLERREGASCEEMVELRKHDRIVLERAKANKWPGGDKRLDQGDIPGVIRVGHKAVDAHCMGSTLGGEAGQLLDQFRRSCLREYFQAVRICQEKGLILNSELLDRVLLYPAELPRSECMKRLALPKGPLSDISSQFARPPKKPKTPPEIRHRDKVKRSKNGALMMDVRHMYPPAGRIAPSITKENLSTGRALVSRKVDAWMTFEEYDKYTKHLPVRYRKLNIKPRPGSNSSNITGYGKFQLDESKFWPGYMLDKLVLFDPAGKGWGSGSNALFTDTSQPKPSNLGKVKDTGPPVHRDGRVVPYGIDKNRHPLPLETGIGR